MTRHFSVISVLVLALALGACGKDDKKSSATSAQGTTTPATTAVTPPATTTDGSGGSDASGTKDSPGSSDSTGGATTTGTTTAAAPVIPADPALDTGGFKGEAATAYTGAKASCLDTPRKVLKAIYKARNTDPATLAAALAKQVYPSKADLEKAAREGCLAGIKAQ